MKCEQIKSGHIHKTFLVTTDKGERYILQWINQFVFPNVDAIMNNVSAISAYLEKTAGDHVPMIRYLRTRDDKSYYEDGNGGAWRAYPYVPNSMCLQRPETMRTWSKSGTKWPELLPKRPGNHQCEKHRAAERIRGTAFFISRYDRRLGLCGEYKR